MARIPRSEYAFRTGFYHLITRGNNGMDVFQDELDFRSYLTLLRRCKEKYYVKLYAYCLMTNHVHLLVEIGRQNSLPQFMQFLNFGYSVYHKGRHNRMGHLWQGRYKSYVIEKEEYLYTCVQYIENNPVKAGLVTDATGYPWSSYRSRTVAERASLLSPLPN